LRGFPARRQQHRKIRVRVVPRAQHRLVGLTCLDDASACRQCTRDAELREWNQRRKRIGAAIVQDGLKVAQSIGGLASLETRLAAKLRGRKRSDHAPFIACRRT
jgi:hypothetical protein